VHSGAGGGGDLLGRSPPLRCPPRGFLCTNRYHLFLDVINWTRFIQMGIDMFGCWLPEAFKIFYSFEILNCSDFEVLP